MLTLGLRFDIPGKRHTNIGLSTVVMNITGIFIHPGSKLNKNIGLN